MADFDDEDTGTEIPEDDKIDEETDWGRGFHGEFFGEERQPIPEDRGWIDIKQYESPEESENAMIEARDPKKFMMEQLKMVLFNLVTDRPDNVVDYFEEYVRYTITKEEKIEPMFNVYGFYFNITKLMEQTNRWIQWKDEPQPAVEGEGAALKKEYIFLNRMDNFEDAGMSLTQLEIFGIAFALQVIPILYPVETVKFWGKIFGLYKNYYVIEADVTKELLEDEANKERERKEAMQGEDEHKFGLEREELGEEEEEYKPIIKWYKIKKLAQYIKPPMPKSEFVPPKFAPKERLGTGVNKKAYYVSNEPADGYIKLPEVTPEQVVRARQVKRFFTGLLEEEILSDPPFPGNESNFLRAQIARISAGTQVSPLGFYSFDLGEAGYEEEEEEGEGDEDQQQMKLPKPEFAPNPDFEPIPLQDLVDPSLAFWVHHAAHILPQGRAVWVDPNIDPNKPKPEGEDFDAKKVKAIPETGPPLLTAVSDDMNLEMIPPWSTRLTMDLAPSYGGAVVRSNLWLGAFAYALHNDANFDNIYIGWGVKTNACSFTPITYFIPQNEYEIGPDTTEITDPNPEEEDYEEILYRQKLEEEKLKKMGDELETHNDDLF